jgi:hypothetical protein
MVSSGLIAEAPGQTHRPKVGAERPGHAVDPTQRHRCGVVQPGAVVKESIGHAEAEVVALSVGGDGRITLPEQAGKSEQIKLVAL